MRLLPLLTLLVAAPALAEDWAASFPAPAVAGQLDLDGGAILVAAANPDAREAAKAIDAALRASGRVRLVMDDSALGDLAGLSDPQIVERCRGLPLDRVLTVRVFAREGGPSSAVASLYDLAGARKAGFAAEAGQPLPGKAAQAAPPPPTAEGKSARDLYDERYIGFADVQIFDGTSGKVLSKWIEPYQGKFRQPLEGVRFYEVAGRPDLAAAYRKRSHVRLGVALGGAGLVLGGGGLVAWGLAGSCSKVYLTRDECLARDRRPLIAGGVVGGVGLLAILASTLISPHPIDSPTAREVADTYNKNLRKEFGLQEARRERAPGPMPLAAAELSVEF